MRPTIAPVPPRPTISSRLRPTTTRRPTTTTTTRRPITTTTTRRPTTITTRRPTTTTTRRPTTTTRRPTTTTTSRPTTTTTRRPTTTTTRRPTTTTTRRPTPTTQRITTTPIPEIEEEEEDDLVLDFSSGSPQMVPNTATQVEVKNETQVTQSAGNAFSTFREIIDRVDIAQELEAAGNVTIFSPVNKAFDELPSSIEDTSLATLRRWILKHFVKGFLFKKDMLNGPVSSYSNNNSTYFFRNHILNYLPAFFGLDFLLRYNFQRLKRLKLVSYLNFRQNKTEKCVSSILFKKGNLKR